MKRRSLIGWASVLVLMALLSAGCMQTSTRKYDISVRNETGHTITIWLTKDGPPVEPGWKSPEQMAMYSQENGERLAGVVIPTGKTASTGELKGEFAGNASAWLRVYDGQYKSFSMLLAVSPRSRDRLDYALYPGKNQLIVKLVEGKLEVEEESAAAGALRP